MHILTLLSCNSKVGHLPEKNIKNEFKTLIDKHKIIQKMGLQFDIIGANAYLLIN